MRQTPAPSEPPRFRTDDLRWYFVAKYLASPGLLHRAKELSADYRLVGAFEFLPRLLAKAERDELGKHMEKASSDAQQEGKPANLALEHYRKNWRRPKP
jgi:hypothetical protein